MPQKILIAAPDNPWNSQMQAHLESAGYSCHVTNAGKDCQLMVYKEKFSLVLLDPDLTNHSGMEVLKFLRLNYPALNVVLLLNEKKSVSDVKTFQEGQKKMGVNKVFTRPFALKILTDHLSDVFKNTSWKNVTARDAKALPQQEVKLRDAECTRVEADSFLNGNAAIFDFYLRLGTDRYVMIIQRGDYLDAERVSKYVVEGVKYFYFLTKDRKTYINYMNEMTKAHLSEQNSGEIKSTVSQIKNTSDLLLDEIYTKGLKSDLVEESNVISQNINGMLNKSPVLKEYMRQFSEMDPEKYSHSFLVSFFASLICKNLSWVGPRSRELITLGAFMHDIGHLKLPSDIRLMDEKIMSPAQLEIYHQHPRLGAEMLAKSDAVSQQVIQIVYQHHESMTGNGYPNKLTAIRIYPLAKVVSVADGFASLLMDNRIAPLEGIKLFLQDRIEIFKYDPAVVKALVQIFSSGKQ